MFYGKYLFGAYAEIHFVIHIVKQPDAIAIVY